MARRRPSAITVALTGLVVAASVGLHAQARQRALYVSALDKAGAPITDLTPEDVVVREDNVSREILRVVPATEPLYLALLVDNSEAAEPYIANYRRALPEFIKVMLDASAGQAGNQISLIGLAARPTIITQYTSDATELLRGVNRLFSQPDTVTYLLDAVEAVTRGFMRGRLARPVIVSIVTAGPDYSDSQHTQVLEALRSSGAAFHAVTLGLPVNLSLDRGIMLERGTRDTGGNYDNLLSGSALPDRLRRLAAELTHQYRVVYSRPQSLVPPERISVTGARPDVIVRGTVPIMAEQDRP
jgi:hypothetical protein